MPNYTNTVITADFDFDFEKNFTSFNDVKPLPKLLLKCSAGSASAIFDDNIGISVNQYIKKLFSRHGRADKTSTRKKFRAKRLYRYYKKALNIHGYSNWYDWSIASWGTKWDMIDAVFNKNSTIFNKNNIEFDTAWTHPFEAIEALSEKYPDITFNISYSSDDMGYSCGEYTICDGDMQEWFFPDSGTNEAMEISFRHYGDEGFELVDGLYEFVGDD